MPESVEELIRGRKSVRTFDSRPLSADDRRRLAEHLQAVDNPFGVPVTFRLLEAEEYGLSSPVVAGARLYLAAKAPRQEHFELACGYSFERVCLYARSLGIGTVMLAASLNRAAFERAMAVRADQVLPVASPVGYPAAKRTVREGLMRRALKADERRPFETLFFRETYGNGVSLAGAGRFGPGLELVRWAPSAANHQPWRAIITEDAVHFYKKSSIKPSSLGDIQKLDVGIALAHFDLWRQEAGERGTLIFRGPALALPENVTYVATYRPEGKA